MKIYAVTQQNNKKYNLEKISNNVQVRQSFMQQNYISNVFYKPRFEPNFNGLWLIDNIIKKVEGKNFQGLGLFNGDYIDFLKVGADNLAQEPLDIINASDNEVYAYWHANALRETYESTWVRRYNKYNTTNPLAVFHTLSSKSAHKLFAENLKVLHDLSRCKSLDIPITDKLGKLSLDCVVFDTETTGLNIFGNDNSVPLDKIVQIGAIQVKHGKAVSGTAFSQLVNPEMPIPKAASDVHGITDEMVKDSPTMEKVLKPFLNNYLNKSNGIIVAYNSKFDMTILNNAIREHNVYSHEDLKQKQMFKVLDPFVLIQRLHPYLGSRKKLGEQYQFLFSKNMENAHDAFADVKGTVDVLKYALYRLSESRKDKSKPLTLREVLIFQNGGRVKNINIPLDLEGCNSLVNYDKSYLRTSVNVDNYFKGYKLTKQALIGLTPQIGPDNVEKLKSDKVINRVVDLNPKDGYPINPAETKMLPKKGGIENAFYALRKNFNKVLEFSNLEPYGDMSIEDIQQLITDKSKSYIHENSIDIWIKNTNPKDIKDGNDLPDLAIARRVMKEAKEQDICNL